MENTLHYNGIRNRNAEDKATLRVRCRSGVSMPASILTGLRPSAQGCRDREATLGDVGCCLPQPQRGCVDPIPIYCHNPVGVTALLARQTRIVSELERRLSVVEELESVVSANLQRATRLRQSIIPKAFTG